MTMWNTEGQNASLLKLKAQRLEQEKKRRRAKQLESKANFHLTRVSAEVKVMKKFGVTSAPVEARIFSIDFLPAKMRLYVPTRLLADEVIAITIPELTHFYIRGRVTWCRRYNVDSPCISSKPFPYRVEVEFLFNSETEKAAVSKYSAQFFQKYFRTAGTPVGSTG